MNFQRRDSNPHVLIQDTKKSKGLIYDSTPLYQYIYLILFSIILTSLFGDKTDSVPTSLYYNPSALYNISYFSLGKSSIDTLSIFPFGNIL